MKSLILIISFFSLACTSLLLADDTQNSNAPNIEMTCSYNHVNRAKFKHPSSQRHHHLTFSEGYVLGTYIQKLKSKSELLYGLGYMNTKFHFSHHPKRTSFKQSNFNNLLAQFGAVTQEIEKWKLEGQIGLQMNTEHLASSRYTFVSGLLHGVQDYNDQSKLHVGIVGYAGMRYTRILPIIGFDYKFSDQWKLNAVFPLNMSVVYSINKYLSLDASIRYFLTRQRLNDHGHYPRGLVAYRNWGAETGVNYQINERMSVNVHVGESFAGRMRISTRKDSHRKHLKLDSAMYYGFSADFAF